MKPVNADILCETEQVIDTHGGYKIIESKEIEGVVSKLKDK